MSPIAQALHTRFEEVCRTELVRLRKKTASLPPEARAEVDALSVAVTHAIAAQVEAALDREAGGDLEAIVARLFAVVTVSEGAGGGLDGDYARHLAEASTLASGRLSS